jgi:diguanylate cyclase (GGDEF)-like protein
MADFNEQTTEALGARTRASIAATPFVVGQAELRVTISVGIASLDPSYRPEQVLKAADEALYEAKRTGRNRVCSS